MTITPYVTFWKPGNEYRLTFGEWQVRGGKNPPSVRDKQYQGGTDGHKAMIEIIEISTVDSTLTIRVSAIEKYPWE